MGEEGAPEDKLPRAWVRKEYLKLNILWPE
jgi:hypothetical protein